MFDPPVLICVRDRVKPLAELVRWLERAGHERIVLVDNASTWEPCVQYLKDSPHQVIHLGRNLGARGLWEMGQPNEYFVWTDPDVVPTEDCPLDAIDYLRRVLDWRKEVSKAGLGLLTEDIPEGMASLDHERGLLVGREIEPGLFRTIIDTTFALYRPGAVFSYQAIRTSAPYLARHTPWFLEQLGEEEVYYLEHAKDGETGSSWAGHYRDMIARHGVESVRGVYPSWWPRD